MRWIDLLRMSSTNLKRRKLRTFLTVLGVVIGTASIVVMISLGLGMQQSMYQEIEESGGMTSITVTGKDAGMSMMSLGGGGTEQQESKKHITDDLISQLRLLEHVKSAEPTINMQAILLKGKYEGYIELCGMTQEALKNQNINIRPGGTLPEAGGKDLDLVVGNLVISNFTEKATGKGYWETGVMPDIDFENDQMFLILDQERYFESRQKDSGASGGEGTNQKDQAGTKKKKGPVKKHVVRASGVVEGTMDTYNANSYLVYCDIDVLRGMLKKEFAGGLIPGQPTTKTGKPYREFVYGSVKVQADDMENVKTLTAAIQELGYKVTTNAEYMESMQKQFAMIQAVLGGIGAVSLLVAAIGIANTMMMSIYERTKEIGVIKVLGCSLKNIKQLFLLEAAYIGFLGGVIGNLLSFLMSFVINVLTKNSGMTGYAGNISFIPFWLVGASMLFAVFVGITAGYFPALRAMRLSPLAAIRNE